MLEIYSRILAICVLITLSSTCFSNGLSPEPISNPPVIDGVLTDAVWQTSPSGTDFIEESSRTVYATQTQFWVRYDQKFVYFGVRAFEEPGKISATETRDDVGLDGNDRVTFFLDLFGTSNNFNSFSINPLGATNIGIDGGRANKKEWRGQIQAKAVRDSQGWTAEMQIPWAILRLPLAGKRTALINVTRLHYVDQKSTSWRDVFDGKDTDYGRWEGLQIPESKVENKIELLPYSYLGSSDDNSIFNSGLDYRTKFGNIEAVGTINPDFRNIERGILSLDFSYSERLANESRPFFSEGSAFFQSGGGIRLFASQRFPQFDVGTKVFSKINDRTRVGVMNLATFGKENFTLASYRSNPNQKESLLVAATSLRRKGLSNESAYFNYSYDVGSRVYYTSQYLTMDSIRDVGTTQVVGYYDQNEKFSTSFQAYSVSSNFAPRAGFVPQRDSKGLEAGLNVNAQPKRSAINSYGYGLSGSRYWRQNGDPFTSSFNSYFYGDFGKAFSFNMGLGASTFEEFKDSYYSIGFGFPANDRYNNFGFGLSAGRTGGRTYSSQDVYVNSRPIKDLQLGLSAQFYERTRKSTQVIGTANWAMDKSHSLGCRIVRRDKDWNGYLSFSRSGNLGAEYFLIIGDPNAEKFRRSIILKVTVPFTVNF